ncbi:hypothetical protein [Alteromonas halophila]|uniref:Uncharacterized protein n=1 Tax=Alteromonas halophila TaxID=516698 RepID=A0A918N1Z8_9ALTE|nr:hypothetical protein [Alteromonas halophila]GGW96784.1 hypothetical protein GCM10007391_33570 [Alteromonas halophila]
MDDVKVFISVCDGVDDIEVSGAQLKGGDKAVSIKANLLSLNDDKVKIEIPELDVSGQVGDASKLKSLSVLLCEGAVTVIPQYVDESLNIMRCCSCCTRNGVRHCVYGSSGCVCC